MERTLIFRPWSTSRGQGTYGYPLLSAYDTETDKSFRAMGGGYDITGTVFGEWLTAVMQDELRRLAESGRAYYDQTQGYPTRVNDGPDALYGMRWREDGSVSVDGACGFSCVRRIAEAAGATVVEVHGKRYVQSVTLIWSEEETREDVNVPEGFPPGYDPETDCKHCGKAFGH